MKKTNLQERAERAAGLFRDKARKPLVIEFAGVPKAGKTTTLTQVQAFLKRCGFRTDVMVERASVCPIRDKKHANFNIWTLCTTLAQILEKTQNPPRSDDPQILFLDRGLFDSICWLTMMEKLSRIRQEDRETVQRFLSIDDWRKRVSAVFLMLSSPSDAMKREQSVLPVVGDGGSIMNIDVLRQVKAVNEECAELLSKDFRIFQINTSEGETRDDPIRTAEVVADLVIGLIEEHIAEEILSLPKELVTKAFGNKNFIPADRTQRFLLGSDQSDFRIRDQVEDDKSRVQALPIVVIRNADGDVLRLRRRERTSDNPLHDKVVLWAGGHVRREDDDNGDPLIRCVARELEEELRLQIRLSDLVPIGAVYFDNGGSTSKHVAIAYEWRSVTNDVSVVLSRSEFFERRGTSLSGSFAGVDKLVADVRTKRLKEPWSVELIREHLAKGAFGEDLSLFDT
jgi:predicted NUDIX family phosphoesterase